MADAYLNLGGWGHVAHREAYPHAKAAVARALAIDETLAEAHVSLAMVQKYDQAIAQLQKTVEMDDNFWEVHLWLGWTFANIGRLSEALAELQTARRLDNNLEIVAALGYTYGRAGQRLEAQQVLDELQQLSRKRYVSPMLSALIAIGMGNHDHVLQCTNHSRL